MGPDRFQCFGTIDEALRVEIERASTGRLRLKGRRVRRRFGENTRERSNGEMFDWRLSKNVLL